jgi:hypothetical protein
LLVRVKIGPVAVAVVVSATAAVDADPVETAIANADANTKSFQSIYRLSQMGGANHLALFL